MRSLFTPRETPAGGSTAVPSVNELLLDAVERGGWISDFAPDLPVSSLAGLLLMLAGIGTLLALLDP